MGGHTRNLDRFGQFCKCGSQSDSDAQEVQAVTSMAIDSDRAGTKKMPPCTHPL
ncbi:hypothetical protein DNHGIG_28720 [Collibacillus ludicampi]|uniref:Uncharacterized protein n=1 Tax=Collibacillus ludicampi TaxID=2771369 RepID=A0AAV4LI45_9BACL|nr:hypothetical protein DNHGIG_28720 [Collibacillus ludicampi]